MAPFTQAELGKKMAGLACWCYALGSLTFHYLTILYPCGSTWVGLKTDSPYGAVSLASLPIPCCLKVLEARSLATELKPGLQDLPRT
jgi:hypothetical protein